MGRLGGSSLLVLGLLLALAGIIIRSDILETLLDIIGIIFIAAGIVLAVVGLVGMVFGRRGYRGY